MNAPKHTFTFSFDLPFIRRALRRDRNEAVFKIVAIYAIVTPLLAWLMGADSGLFYGILGGGFVATVTFVVSAFHKGGKNVHDVWLQQSPSGTIRYQLDDEGYTVQMDNANSRHAWQGLRRLWCYPDVWLLEIIKNQSTFFPTEAASPEIQDYIRERCRSGGAKV